LIIQVKAKRGGWHLWGRDATTWDQ